MDFDLVKTPRQRKPLSMPPQSRPKATPQHTSSPKQPQRKLKRWHVVLGVAIVLLLDGGVVAGYLYGRSSQSCTAQGTTTQGARSK